MPGILSRIVEVTVFRRGRNGPEYLILKRSATERIYPGLWQIVTGTINGSEQAVACALREVKEETGCEPVRFWRLPFVNSFYDASADAIHLCPHFAAEISASSEPTLSREHDASRWCSRAEAEAVLPWKGQREGVRLTDTLIVPETEEARLLEISSSQSERKPR